MHVGIPAVAAARHTCIVKHVHLVYNVPQFNSHQFIHNNHTAI
jgi:hypothetical protein